LTVETAGSAPPCGQTLMNPRPVAFTAYTFIASAATPFGIEHVPAVPPWVLKFAENPTKLRDTFANSAPPALRVSRMRQGASGV